MPLLFKPFQTAVKVGLFGFCCLFFMHQAQAQDYHISQYHIFPLSINPAMTGDMPDDYRLSALRRFQWASLGNLFQTTAINAEISLKDGVGAKNLQGIGLGFYEDQLGDNMMRRQSMLLSFAYGLVLDKQRRHRLNGGVQFSYEFLQVDINSLSFGNQFERFEFNPLIPSGEYFATSNRLKYNINAGLKWEMILSDKLELTTALSIYNSLGSRRNLTESQIQSMAFRRINVFSQMRIHAADNWYLTPSLLVMHQSGENLFTTGGEAELYFSKSLSLYAGAWYRLNDAIVGLAGIRLNDLQFRVSYDLGHSEIGSITEALNVNNQGRDDTFEISLVYTGHLFKTQPVRLTVPCETF